MKNKTEGAGETPRDARDALTCPLRSNLPARVGDSDVSVLWFVPSLSCTASPLTRESKASNTRSTTARARLLVSRPGGTVMSACLYITSAFPITIQSSRSRARFASSSSSSPPRATDASRRRPRAAAYKSSTSSADARSPRCAGASNSSSAHDSTACGDDARLYAATGQDHRLNRSEFRLARLANNNSPAPSSPRS